MCQVSTPTLDSQRPKEMIYLSLSQKQIFINDDTRVLTSQLPFSIHSTLELSPLTVPATTALF